MAKNIVPNLLKIIEQQERELSNKDKVIAKKEQELTVAKSKMSSFESIMPMIEFQYRTSIDLSKKLLDTTEKQYRTGTN
jgi:uncharacterized protein (DUF3084 family)